MRTWARAHTYTQEPFSEREAASWDGHAGISAPERVIRPRYDDTTPRCDVRDQLPLWDETKFIDSIISVTV